MQEVYWRVYQGHALGVGGGTVKKARWQREKLNRHAGATKASIHLQDCPELRRVAWAFVPSIKCHWIKSMPGEGA